MVLSLIMGFPSQVDVLEPKTAGGPFGIQHVFRHVYSSAYPVYRRVRPEPFVELLESGFDFFGLGVGLGELSAVPVNKLLSLA